MPASSLSLDTDALLREQDAADLLSLSVRTLQSWRIRMAGPPFVQVGRAVRYRRRDLIAWIDANTIGAPIGSAS
ncbi:helix-turn-helix transcriptional regulator [Bradyrhizobium erythrophlei]|uniref:Helix-turn-helix domain-containing protein n=1 Tax=Bradyrhizobium erythrophlei TaxID=1437360 RepID=A0A1M5SRH2_9BRAD|nr:helix-turn-helix domain-containing protein [Bradyrhizobium erythrophlei]SHH41096.1 Helix-turn-helix domain-containing protein [Bradyrhizobium erythrophlei]